MNTVFYKYALEVERAQSITQAAENLFMAQPNLSKAIKEMEDNLGFIVFERTPKGVIPTTKGMLFLEYARNIVLQLEKIEHIATLDNKAIQQFNICTPRGSYISKAVTRFIAQLDHTKGMTINIQETNAMQTMAHIVEGKFNLGIIRYQTIHEPYYKNYLAEKNLSAELVWDFAYWVVMSKHHPLAKSSTLQREDLEDSIELVHGDNVIPYIIAEKDEKRRQPSEKEKRIYVYERANQFEILTRINQTYMWVSKIPEDMLARYELVQIPCDYAHNAYKDVLIYPKDYHFSSYDKQFINLLFEVKNEVLFNK